MPTATFFSLPADKRERLVNEAIYEFSERSYAEASLSQIAQRSKIPKGSFYQYFEDKLDLYRWLITEEAPRYKKSFLGTPTASEDFWVGLEHHIERGMAFLVEHPRLARLTASSADPSATPEVRGLHNAICEAGIDELRARLELGITSGAIRAPGLDVNIATRLVAAILGPGLTDVVLRELGAELHEVLASDTLRNKLGPSRRKKLAKQAILLIKGGLGQPNPPAMSPPRSRPTRRKERT